ncbi:MAG TPA: tRNA (cytidine(56)-2'-O)-methyltransferase, partial [Candidatus Caldiarchaeum subterraneum]|nr:tRNA (cytidine(56)-2'-O)-methyltransferase [Candidatus Caldarchaeum subterraneum]
IHVIHEFKKRKAVIIHLTMYGLPLKQVIGEIRRINKEQELLIIVGGPKVENEIFHLADYNVAVTSQPHSEVSALAVFLDWLHEGKELEKEFEDARLKITPQKQGKKIIRRDEAIHNYRTYPTS